MRSSDTPPSSKPRNGPAWNAPWERQDSARRDSSRPSIRNSSSSSRCRGVFLNTFTSNATPDQTAFYQSTVKGAAVDDVNRMRKIAIDSIVSGSTGDIDAGIWFQKITEKINLMKSVEDRLATDFTTRLTTLESAASSQFFLILSTTIALLSLTIVGSLIIIWGITGPINDSVDVMENLVKGNLEVDIPGLDRTDEIGGMAQSIEIFKQNAIEVQKMEADKAAQEERIAAEKKAAMNAMADDFENRVSAIVETVSSSSAQLTSTAQSMTKAADDANQQTTTVAAASEEASTNVQTVASAAEELSASVNEINRQVTQSAEIAGRANDDAQRTNETVQSLASAAQKIGEVVELISDIAEQTNLLAPERHHRSRPRRRSRQRLRRRRVRGEKPGDANGESDGGYQRSNLGNAVGDF